MILSLTILGTEVFRLEIGAPAAEPADNPDVTVTHRHAGEFGFGNSPVRPYWNPDPEELPAVATGVTGDLTAAHRAGTV